MTETLHFYFGRTIKVCRRFLSISHFSNFILLKIRHLRLQVKHNIYAKKNYRAKRKHKESLSLCPSVISFCNFNHHLCPACMEQINVFY